MYGLWLQELFVLAHAMFPAGIKRELKNCLIMNKQMNKQIKGNKNKRIPEIKNTGAQKSLKKKKILIIRTSCGCCSCYSCVTKGFASCGFISRDFGLNYVCWNVSRQEEL